MTDHNDNRVSFSARRILVGWVSAILLIACATYLLQIATVRGAGLVVLIVAPLCLVFWALFGRGQWWAPLPIACSLGGMLYFGFRIYTHELALLLAILALLPYFTLSAVRKENRPSLSVAIYLLFGYLCIHLLFSEYMCVQEGTGGLGNVLRVYVYGLWAIAFAILFTRYGSTRQLKYILMAMYIAAFTRVALGVVSYLAPPQTIFYIPIINYILPGTLSAGMDLRASSLLLASLALCYSSFTKSGLARLFHLSVLIPAGYLLLLGGSRISLAMFFGIILLWACVQRRFIILGTTAVSLALLIGALNNDPAIIGETDLRIQRTLSILVIKNQNTDIHKPIEGSDQWHYSLMNRGLNRWLSSPMTILFGNRVHRYDDSFYSPWVSIGTRVELAAKMGSYESGLWTILAVTGISGAILYALIFFGLLKSLIPALISRGISDHADAFCFLAVSGAAMWLLLCWIAGHFPSQELMLAVIAKAALDDRQRTEKQNGEVMAEDPDTAMGPLSRINTAEHTA
ncbi:MAG: hypothetical protein WCN95_01600 [bacterium]